MPKIVILLSTYNGMQYLEDQVRSIERQTFDDWALLVRDDGSSDDTYQFLEKLKLEENRIFLLPKQDNIGVIQSFSALVEEAIKLFPEAAYFMFADQDDVWKPTKVEDTLKCMKALEVNHEYVLVHTDLQVVDSSLNTIASSFMKFQHIRHSSEQALSVLLVQNFVTGCTVMLNRKLVLSALPIPRGVMMHDWWFALCAAAYGQIGFVNQPTILYRQHEENSVGAKGFWGSVKLAIKDMRQQGIRIKRFLHLQEQANALLMRMRKILSSEESMKVVESFLSLNKLNYIQRFYVVWSCEIKPQYYLRTFAFFLDLLRLPRKD